MDQTSLLLGGITKPINFNLHLLGESLSLILKFRRHNRTKSFRCRLQFHQSAIHLVILIAKESRYKVAYKVAVHIEY
jgi:hypothetical protein